MFPMSVNMYTHDSKYPRAREPESPRACDTERERETERDKRETAGLLTGLLVFLFKSVLAKSTGRVLSSPRSHSVFSFFTRRRKGHGRVPIAAWSGSGVAPVGSPFKRCRRRGGRRRRCSFPLSRFTTSSSSSTPGGQGCIRDRACVSAATPAATARAACSAGNAGPRAADPGNDAAASESSRRKQRERFTQ